MRYLNTDYTVVYVDPSASTAGDGTAPSSPLTSLPAAASLATGTCYLIRRTSTALALPNGTCAAARIILMGMPKSTDREWGLVPSDAQTAWGSDAADYATVEATSSSQQLQLSSAVEVALVRLNMVRSNVSSASTSYYLVKHTLANNSSSPKAVFTVAHCRFGVSEAAIDDASYTGTYTNGAMSSYLSIGAARLLSLDDTVICHKQFSQASYGIYAPYLDMLNIRNCTVHDMADNQSYGDAQPAIYAYAYDTTTGTEAVVTGLNVRYMLDGSSHYYFKGILFLYSFKTVRIHGMNATMYDPYPSSHPSRPYLKAPMLKLTSCGAFDIGDCNVQLPYLPQLDSTVFTVESNNINDSDYCHERQIHDLTMSVGGSSAIGSAGTYTSSSYYLLNVSPSYASSSTYYPKPVQLLAVSLTNRKGAALFARACSIRDAILNGYTNLSACSAEILTMAWDFPGKILSLSNNCDVCIGTLTMNLENPDYPYSGDSPFYSDPVGGNYNSGNRVHISSSNIPLTPASGTGTDAVAMMSAASGGVQGQYVAYTQSATVETWNVRRTGGADACLKLSNTRYNTQSLVGLGRKPYRGLVVEVAESGTYMLRLHIAAKGYSDLSELPWRFLVTATADEHGSAPYHAVSSADGVWLDDSTAVWENDDGLTPLVLEMPVTVTRPDDGVDVRMYFGWYASSGFIYVDPEVELVAQS